MTTQYTPILKLALPVTGELSGTWGDTVNDNITSMVEQAVAGLATISTWTSNSHTLTTANGTTSESRCAMLVAQDGAGLTAAGEIVCPAASKLYVLKNATSYAITLKTSAGSGVAVASGNTAFLFCDGTNVNACVTTIVDGRVTGNLTVDGNATINGNTTLGNATSDTITATARFASGLTPSADNTYDLGSSGNSWKDVYIDGTAYLALVDINGGTIDGVSIGASTAATIINVDNLRLDGNTLSSTDTNGNVVIAPNGTGDVQLDADTVRVGDSGAAATLTSNGAGALTVTTGGAANLVLSTNSGTTSGTITIANGANGNIAIVPDGTGDVQLDADTVRIGDANTDVTLTTNGTGNLNLTTNGGTNSGTIQIAQGANGNITLTPNGTGLVSIPSAVISGGTANGVAYLNGSKVLTTGSALTFGGATLTVNRGAAGEGLASSFGSAAVRLDTSVGHSGNGVVTLNAYPTASPSSAAVMVWQLGGSEQMRLTSTGLGIGTSSPLSPLNIQQNGDTLSNGFTLTRTGANRGTIFLDATNDTLNISRGVTASLAISAAGNVGIGTSSPSTLLHLQSASAPTLRFSQTATSTAYGNIYTDANGTININADAGNAGAGETIFRVFVDNTERMRIDSSGNVGIGTSSPVYLLDVRGQAGIELYNATTSGNVLNFRPSLGDANKYNMSISAFDHSGGGVGPADGLSINGFDGVSIATGSSTVRQERMRIDSSGNVGIGTSSPTQRLHVKGVSGSPAIRVETSNGTNNSTQPVLTAGTDNLTYQAQIALVREGSSGLLGWSFLTNAVGSPTERLRITSAGNVGIGTSSPSASAILDAQSTTKGVRMPNMTTAQKNAISSPAAGLMVFDTTLAKLCVYTGAAWQTITST